VLQIQFYSGHCPRDTPALHPEVSHRSPGQPLTTWEGYAPKVPGSLPGKTKIFLSFSERPYLLWRAPILIFNRYWVALFSGLQRPGRDSHHSPHSTAEFKNGWSYISTPIYAFMAYTAISSPLRSYAPVKYRSEITENTRVQNDWRQQSVGLADWNRLKW